MKKLNLLLTAGLLSIPCFVVGYQTCFFNPFTQKQECTSKAEYQEIMKKWNAPLQAKEELFQQILQSHGINGQHAFWYQPEGQNVRELILHLSSIIQEKDKMIAELLHAINS